MGKAKKSSKSDQRDSSAGRVRTASSGNASWLKWCTNNHLIWIAVIAVVLALGGFGSSPTVPAPASRTRAVSRRSVEKPWPWTEQTQPKVAEVLHRAANLTDVNGRPISPQVLHRDKEGHPIVIMIDNFLTDGQAELMIRLAIEQGLERSTTTGEMVDGKFKRPMDDSRTSSNSWCFNDCFRDPIVGEVDKMIEEVVARPKKNMEHYQLLHYEIGQEYKEHHDFIYDQAIMSQGPRQFTFFLYLNDVEEGGETEFINLGIKVKPKRGRAVLWPNVWFNSKTENNKKMHPLTMHAARPVRKGQKYSANKWVHKGDFLTPWSTGVSG